MLRSVPRPALALLLAGASVLAACSDTSTGAITAPAAGAPVRSVGASETGEYLVRLKGNGNGFRASVEALGGTVSFVHEGAGVAVVSGLSAAAATQLAGASSVAEVQPNGVMVLSRPKEPVIAPLGQVGIASQANPAAALRYSWQWNMKAIHADQAWAAGKLGSPAVTVAILDTGIDYNSLDANGLVDLSRSTSFIPSDDAIIAANFPGRHVVDDLNGHGTNVASQVSSTGAAHAGVSSRTTLMGVKVLGADGSGAISAVLQGILWAADHDADVINLSLGVMFTRAGNGQLIRLFNQVFSYAKRQGVVVVVAAGNESTDLDRNLIPDENGELQRVPGLYAAYCDAQHVICVSATGPETFGGSPDVPAYYTNFGRSAINVAAPGGNASNTLSVWPWGTDNVSWVWSMCPKNLLINPATPSVRPCASGGSVNALIGTSQAAPHVAGLAALLVAELGKDNPAQVKARIQQSADDLGQPGTDPYFGKGRINVARALGL